MYYVTANFFLMNRATCDIYLLNLHICFYNHANVIFYKQVFSHV